MKLVFAQGLPESDAGFLRFGIGSEGSERAVPI